LLIHGIAVAAFLLEPLLLKPAAFRPMGSGYVQVESGAAFGNMNNPLPPAAGEEQSEKTSESEEGIDGQAASAAGQNGSSLNPFGGGDTAGLKNYYAETTLNVRIRYPDGWAFLDQPKNGKLDAVTFMGLRASNGAIPYIILEVKEKYLFNPSQYQHVDAREHYALYYNDPENLEQQVSQTVYVRTERNEDYSIKMIVTGEDAFHELQLAFFAMIETFRFGEMQ
jgi:hypothetical protein